RAVRGAPGSLEASSLLVFAMFAAGLLPQAIQRPDSTHLSWVSAVPFGLLPAAGVEILRRTAPRWRDSRRLLAAAVLPAVLLLVIVPHFTWRTYSDAVAQTFGVHREA